MKHQVAVLGVLVLVSSCGETTTQPTPRNLRGDVTDPAGDTRSSPSGVAPDLRSGSIEINAATNAMLISVRCAPGTFNSATTIVQFDLDLDQNPATGSPFEGLGLEYIVNMGSPLNAGQAQVFRFVGGAGTGYQLVNVPLPVTVVADGIDVSIPLSVIGNDDGRMTFRVVTSVHLGGNTSTGILDYMPDSGAPAGVVQ